MSEIVNLTADDVSKALEKAEEKAKELREDTDNTTIKGLLLEAPKIRRALEPAAGPIARQVNRLGNGIISQAATYLGLGADPQEVRVAHLNAAERSAARMSAWIEAEKVRIQNTKDWDEILSALQAVAETAGKAALRMIPILLAL